MREIRKAGVIGAGVMGAAIAAHLANAGVEVLLLDIVPRVPTDGPAAGPAAESAEFRNQLARKGLERARKSRPASFYLPEFSRLIHIGNLADDIDGLAGCDWVIEAVVEDMAIKKTLYHDTIAPHWHPGMILSSNTSGLSVNDMAEEMPEEMRRHFLVTHFFNPPRYLRLVEIVPSRWTDKAITADISAFIERRLGKGAVPAKDTPNFIANRIGVYSLFNAIYTMMDLGLSIEAADMVAGPPTARPKSAAFRTADLVGLDTLLHVARNTYENLPNDESREMFQVPEFVSRLVDDGHLGEKSGQGFYRREKEEGRSVIYHLDYESGNYVKNSKPEFPSLAAARMAEGPAGKLRAVIEGKDPAAVFGWRNIRDTLLYAFRRIPEIADDIVSVDEAMKWGFGWDLGPFEMFDVIGLDAFRQRCREDGVELPDGLDEIPEFYRFRDGQRLVYHIPTGKFREVPQPEDVVSLDLLHRDGREVEQNAEASLLDLGDGVFLLEFHAKMNAVGGGIIDMLHRAVDRAERDGVGLVIGNQGRNFSVGANLMLLAVAIAEGALEDVNLMVRRFQGASMALKYARVPVVAAPFQMTLGGGCEFCLHSDAVNAAAETYMGLVELGVGLIPAGGGTKEMCLRAVDMAAHFETDVQPFLFKNFRNIGMARVSTSAYELFQLGYLRHGDSVTMNPDRLIFDAKRKVQALARNYRPRHPREDIPAPGRDIAASIRVQLYNLRLGGQISEYDEFLGNQLAAVITGGDVPPGTPVSESYLLDLERQTFLRLCGRRETQERIQHMLKKGKPLRN